MTMSDPIADMLARIRNALIVGHPMVRMPASKIKVAIAKILKEEGFIEDYRLTREQPQPQLVIKLKYVGERKDRRAVITGLKRVSKPGRRIYTRVNDIPWVRSGMGVTILTTPKGVVTGQQARRLGVGGEVLCHVW
ncbi:MAG TPA: 30S ribosomal protein S8 [Chloroflexi bacterium]|mgnify:CR=1 FL=1|nr:30S ribosomal protein S8 [Chloroflexota bacterium]